MRVLPRRYIITENGNTQAAKVEKKKTPNIYISIISTTCVYSIIRIPFCF